MLDVQPPYPIQHDDGTDAPAYLVCTSEEQQALLKSRGIYLPLCRMLAVPAVYARDAASGSFYRLTSDQIAMGATVAAALFAKDLLHSIVGFDALATVAKGIVTVMGPGSGRLELQSPTFAKHMTSCFLAEMEYKFPVIAVHDLRGRNCRSTDALENSAHGAAVIEISNRLVNRLLAARRDLKKAPRDALQLQRFQALLLRLGVLVARELCYLFAIHLLYKGYGSRGRFSSVGEEVIGEAPQVWEALTFGGAVDMRDGKVERIAAVVQDRAVHVVHWEVIDALAQRDFTGLPLTDPRPWRPATEPVQLSLREWRRKYGDVFADYAAGDVAPALPPHMRQRLNADVDVFHRQSVDALRGWSMSPVPRVH